MFTPAQKLRKKEFTGKLKVIRCRCNDYWYKNFIGQEFDIIGSYYNDYEVKRDIGKNWYINAWDVKVLDRDEK